MGSDCCFTECHAGILVGMQRRQRQISTDNSSHPQTSTSGDKGSTDPSKQPEVTLTVFSTLANYAGDQPGWFAKLIKDKFNIKLNIIASNLAGGQQKIGTMMASGDLGDIVVGLGEETTQMPSKPACC